MIKYENCPLFLALASSGSFSNQIPDLSYLQPTYPKRNDKIFVPHGANAKNKGQSSDFISLNHRLSTAFNFD